MRVIHDITLDYTCVYKLARVWIIGALIEPGGFREACAQFRRQHLLFALLALLLHKRHHVGI